MDKLRPEREGAVIPTEIFVFLDGTSNDASPAEHEMPSNVRLMFERLSCEQDFCGLYLPGVGTAARHEMDSQSRVQPGISDTLDSLLKPGVLTQVKMIGRMFGAGLTARVLAAYAFICAAKRQHGDDTRLHIVGFSRGAYASCVLAHFLEKAGFVIADQLGLNAAGLKRLWGYDSNQVKQLLDKKKLAEWTLPQGSVEGIKVDFLGCWDTVCALGAPAHGLDFDLGLQWFTDLADGLCRLVHGVVLSNDPRLIEIFVPPNVVKARHALALHEYRVPFEALIWLPPDGGASVDLKQTWFPGAHADVGGGYRIDAKRDKLPDLALRWMSKEMLLKGYWDSPSHLRVWSIHDSGNAPKQTRIGVKVRGSLQQPPEPALGTMHLCEDLRFELLANVDVEINTRRPPLPKGSKWSGKLAREKIPALHDAARAQARWVWLCAALARAFKSSGASPSPSWLDKPEVFEAEIALRSEADFFRDLQQSCMVGILDDPAAAITLSRRCGYRIALLNNPDELINHSLRLVDQASSAAEKDLLRASVNKVILASLPFLLNAERSNALNERYELVNLCLKPNGIRIDGNL